jgi:FkbM family methyltransferase
MFRRKTKLPSAASGGEPIGTRLPDLLAAQVGIFGNAPSLSVVDAGAHHGHTVVQYLEHFPKCRVIALEPEPGNFAIAKETLAPFGERVELLPFALGETDGSVPLRLTSHSGAHSLLEVDDMRYYDAPVETLTPIAVRMVKLESILAERQLDRLDILKMDIQGAELLALRGAAKLLARHAIRLIALEVLFQPLYRNQPAFWDIADYLRSHGYALQGIYEQRHHEANHAILRWADAVFVTPELAALPQVSA